VTLFSVIFVLLETHSSVGSSGEKHHPLDLTALFIFLNFLLRVMMEAGPTFKMLSLTNMRLWISPVHCMCTSFQYCTVVSIFYGHLLNSIVWNHSCAVEV